MQLSFDWKVSSEEGYDLMYVLLDNRPVDAITGEADWESKSYDLTGDREHSLAFCYIKDHSVGEGEDKGYVRDVAFAPASAQKKKGGEKKAAKAGSRYEPRAMVAAASGGGVTVQGRLLTCASWLTVMTWQRPSWTQAVRLKTSLRWAGATGCASPFWAMILDRQFWWRLLPHRRTPTFPCHPAPWVPGWWRQPFCLDRGSSSCLRELHLSPAGSG